MQVTYKEIYNRLADGKPVKVRFSDQKQANALRVQLVRWNQQFVSVGISDNSLCMQWQEATGVAIFELKKLKGTDTLFEILDDSDEQSPSSNQQDRTDSQPLSDSLDENPG